MYIKNNLSLTQTIAKYFTNDILVKRENKFIKEQAKTKYEYLFFKYYDELLSTEL